MSTSGVCCDAGDAFVSCGDDGSLAVWDRSPSSSASEPRFVLRCMLSGYHTRTAYSVHWSSLTGAVVSCGADDTIRVFVEVRRFRLWRLQPLGCGLCVCEVGVVFPIFQCPLATPPQLLLASC